VIELKTNKTLTKEPRKKTQIKRIVTKLKKIIYDKLWFTYIKEPKTKTNNKNTRAEIEKLKKERRDVYFPWKRVKKRKKKEEMIVGAKLSVIHLNTPYHK
jgi:hypothetical protein